MTEYDHAFFEAQQNDSVASARGVLPTIIDVVEPKSILDVGCGVGTWLRVASELGVADILGIDGDYVDRNMLHIPRESFKAHDLTKPFDTGRRFDLAISMEVAEHLPPESAESFVASLVAASPVVMMSAAIPGQGGVSHVNERWQDYWVGLFEKHNYEVFDAVRPFVWARSDVQPYYAQNALLYVDRDRVADYPKLHRIPVAASTLSLRVVHPKAYTGLWNYANGDNVPVRRAANQLAHSLRRALWRRLGRPMNPTLIKPEI